MTKPKIWLHIGIPKTGTTAFQSFCILHEDKLARQKFLYPQTGRRGVAHHELAWAITEVGPKVDRAIYAELKAEILSSGATDIIISSEVFFVTPNVKILSALLSDFDVRILAFLRHQLVWYPAMYQQYIKQNEYRLHDKLEESAVMDVPYVHLDYHKQMSIWAEGFGKDAITAFPYPESTAAKKDKTTIKPKRDTISLIFNSMGLKTALKWPRPEDVGQTNLSLNADELELVRLSNEIDFEATDRSRLLYALQRTSARRPKQDRVPPIYFLSDDMIRKIANGPCASNSELSEFTENPGKPFFDSFPDLDDDRLSEIDLTIEQDSLFEIAASLHPEILNYANYTFGFDMMLANSVLYQIQIEPTATPYMVVLQGTGTEPRPDLAWLMLGSNPSNCYLADEQGFKLVQTGETFGSINTALRAREESFTDLDIVIFVEGDRFTAQIETVLDTVPDNGEIYLYKDGENSVCLVMRISDLLDYRGLLDTEGAVAGMATQLSAEFTVHAPETTLNWHDLSGVIQIDLLDFN